MDQTHRVQTDDLGMIRRECVLTVDDQTRRNARIEVREAARVSNIPGSEAQRVVEANKSEIAGWRNLHQKIGDTEDLKIFDHLENGQTHRLRLNDVIRESGGQNYTKIPPKNTKSLKDGNTLPFVQGFHARTPGPKDDRGARGIEWKKRSAADKVSFALPRTLKPSVPIYTPPRTRGGLDPALDMNNKNDPKASKAPGNPKKITQKATSLKTRRPLLGDFARTISTPESFLAVARNLVNTRISETNLQSTTNGSNDNRHEAALDSSTRRRNESEAITKGNSNENKSQIPKGKFTSLFEEESARMLPTKSVNPDQLKPQPHTLPTTINTSKSANQRSNSVSMSSQSLQKRPLSSPIDVDDRVESTIKPDRPESDLLNSPEHSAVEETKGVSTPRLDERDIMLVDLSSTPTRQTEGELNVSPALEELKGLYFTSANDLEDCSTSIVPSSNKKTDSPECLTESKQPESDVLGNITAPFVKDLAEYERCIEILCNLMESTSLEETFLSKISECKDELEESLKRARAGQWPNKTVKQNQDDLLSGGSTEESKPVAEKITYTTEITPRTDRRTSSFQDETPSPLSRLNAAAPQFVPKSLMEYRSTSSSSSSDSAMNIQPTPSKVPQSLLDDTPVTPTEIGEQTPDIVSTGESFENTSTLSPAASQPKRNTPSFEPGFEATSPTSTTTLPLRINDGPTFGDHLLPGGKARMEQKLHNPHIFGDHLLPGRRVGQQPTRGTNNQPTEKSPVNERNVEKVPVISPRAPQSPKALSPNISVSKSTSSPNRLMVTLGAPQREEPRKVLSPQPVNKQVPSTDVVKHTRKATPVMGTIQESIHAPKTGQAQGSRAFADSLMRSRYAF